MRWGRPNHRVMVMTRCAPLALLFAILPVGSSAVPMDGIRAACEAYEAGFFSTNTDLPYLERLDGPRGTVVLENPAEIAAGRVGGVEKPWGYGSGIEDVALANGLLLFALCDAYDAAPSPWIKRFSRRAFNGMRRVATLSPVPGFIPRGPHPDGVSYYRDSSTDQHTIFVCAMWRFFRSPMADEDDRVFIRRELDEFARRMEHNAWTLMVEDDSHRAHVGWDWRAKNHTSSHILLSMLGAVADATGDPHWRDEYRRFSEEGNGVRWEWVGRDPTEEPRYTLFYNQFTVRLATLMRVEQDPVRRDIVGGRLTRLARDMMSCNAIVQWRRLDWIGEVGDDTTGAFLAPLGLSVKSSATVADLWAKFDPALKPRARQGGALGSYEGLLARPALTAWQTAMLSPDKGLARRALPFAEEVLKKANPATSHSGWLANHAIVYLLLCIAAERT